MLLSLALTLTLSVAPDSGSPGVHLTASADRSAFLLAQGPPPLNSAALREATTLHIVQTAPYLMARLSAQVHNAMYTEKVEVSDFHRFQENSSIEDVAKLMRVR